MHQRQVSLGDPVDDAVVAFIVEGVVAGGARPAAVAVAGIPVAKVALGDVVVPAAQAGRAIVDREIAGGVDRAGRQFPNPGRREAEQVGDTPAVGIVLALDPEQGVAAHHLGDLVLDRTDDVVLVGPGRRGGIERPVGFGAGAEADPAVDGAVVGADQAQRLGFGPADVEHAAIGRIRCRQRREGGELVGRGAVSDQRVADRCIVVARRLGLFAFAEIIGSDRRAVDLAPADMDVEGDVVGERGVEQVHDIGDRGLEGGRSAVRAAVIDDVDLQRCLPGMRRRHQDMPATHLRLGLSGARSGSIGAGERNIFRTYTDTKVADRRTGLG